MNDDPSSPSQGDVFGGDHVGGDKVGGNKYTYYGGKPELSVDDGYAWLLWLVQAYGVVVVEPTVATQIEQRLEAVLRRLGNSAEEAHIHLLWLRRMLVAGTMEGASITASAGPLALSDAHEYAADVLWPLLIQVQPTARKAVALMLALLDAEALAIVFDQLAPGYDGETDTERRNVYRERLVLALEQAPTIAGVRALLGYLAARQTWVRGARDWQRGRATGAMFALGAMQINSISTSAGPAPRTPTPVRVSPHLVRTKSGVLSVPITTKQWQDELLQRDERFGTHGLQHDPIPYWCYLPGGRYRIGGWDDGEPASDVDLLPFWIARVPITVAQYAPFVAQGYRPAAKPWWTPNGWAWREREKRIRPGYNQEKEFNSNHQPVTTVTWYEAAAFCAWLNSQLTTQLPPDYELRLPTEAEWETATSFAGQNNQRRSYPWGEQAPTVELAVYGLGKEGKPALVGSCPQGAAACGALDLAGNVWEAAANLFDNYPLASTQVEKDFTEGASFAPYRGSSYWDDSTRVYCGAREWFLPDDRSLNLGFRVVVTPRRV